MAPPEQLDDDPLAALRERIRSTAAAADRLAEQASLGGNGQSRRTTADGTAEAAQEAQALVALVGLLRDLIPEELRQQILDLVRQVLRLIRAIIDWYLERLETGPGASARGQSASREPVVEDIPLDEPPGV
jgi:hypothetical protein